ncbi:MAG: hypothetical protein ABI644_04845 [Arenimonas sp.]
MPMHNDGMTEARIAIEVARTASVLAAIPDTSTHWLSDSEQARLAAIKVIARREHYITGHWLVRLLLARSFGGEPAQWQLLERKSNPPQVIGPFENLSVSISHSQNWIAAAVANVSFGIDLEQRPRRLDVSIEHLLLNADESPGQLDADTLLQRWVAKEAWIKSRCESALPERLRQLHLQASSDSNADVQIHSNEEWYLGIARTNPCEIELICEVASIKGPGFDILDIHS